MHPHHQYLLYLQRLDAAQARYDERHELSRRARPPGRVRTRTASLLVRLAARLTDEPMVVLPRRA